MRIWLEDIETGKPAELSYKTTLSAGFDIPCKVVFDEQRGITKIPLVRNSTPTVVSTGLRLRYEATEAEIASGLPFLMLVPRSSSVKHGIRLMNSPAVIDLDYEGEIVLQLQNEHPRHNAIYIGSGESYVQGMFISTVRADFEVVNKIRGKGGLGSTTTTSQEEEPAKQIFKATKVATSKPSTTK
jgi:dUTPase